MISWISNLLNNVLCGTEPYNNLGLWTILDKNFDIQVDTKQMLDNGLFITFICIIFTFFLGSAYVFLKEEKKSLKEINNKVRRTSEALTCILFSIWTLKQFKAKTRKMEEDKIKILKMNTCFNLSIQGKDFKVEKKCEDTQKKDVIYCHEEEFPQEFETPPTEGDERTIDAKVEANNVENINITDFVESHCGTFDDRKSLNALSLAKAINSNLDLAAQLKINVKNANPPKGLVKRKTMDLDNMRNKSKSRNYLGAQSCTSYSKFFDKEDKQISAKLGIFERHKKILSHLKNKK